MSNRKIIKVIRQFNEMSCICGNVSIPNVFCISCMSKFCSKECKRINHPDCRTQSIPRKVRKLLYSNDPPTFIEHLGVRQLGLHRQRVIGIVEEKLMKHRKSFAQLIKARPGMRLEATFIDVMHFAICMLDDDFDYIEWIPSRSAKKRLDVKIMNPFKPDDIYIGCTFYLHL